MCKLFIPALEYRIYIQKARTGDQKKAKLERLAQRGKTTVTAILASYANGDDILDPDIFAREDILEFAKEYCIEKDPQVIKAASRARTLAEWARA